MNAEISASGRVVPANFVDHLRRLARERPNEIWLTVAGSQEGRSVERCFSFADFERRVRALAARLQQDCTKGDRVLVMLDNDEHYAASMLACFYAGVIAVPVPPLESLRHQHLVRLLGIVQDARARCVLTSAATQASMQAEAQRFGGLLCVAADEIDLNLADNWKPQAPASDDIAFLQYTSGSTGMPKGVMVSHGNLIANEVAIRNSMDIGASDKFVSWAPLYHDMGLIGGLLQPLFSEVPLVLTSPRHFLESPVRWLELISRHRATLSGGPDFSFRLCLERVKANHLAGLDLSSWRVAYAGAEPVRVDTMTDFSARFSAAGFRAEAVYPCYGLAEATLFVTGGPHGGLVNTAFSPADLALDLAVPMEQGTRLASCGVVAANHEVAIVHPGTDQVLEPGRVGEIWVAGPSVALGYWDKAEASAETFVERSAKRWLRTGDLGLVHQGQLYVTGRLKDLIIVRGHNLYPQDIERVAELEVDAVRKGRVAAFSVPGPQGESLGLAAEVSRGLQKLVEPARLVEALSAAVSQTFGEPLSVVILLNPSGMPKTSSGKLQRQACRKDWMEGSLDAYAVFEHGVFVSGGTAHSASANVKPLADEVEQALVTLWSQALRRTSSDPLGPNAHFFTSGGNSLSATLAAGLIGERWNLNFPVRQIFDTPRLSDCAAAIRLLQAEEQARPLASIPMLSVEQRVAPLALSHAQQRQWFLWNLDPGSNAYHVATVLHLGNSDLKAVALRHALEQLVARHESLRTVFGAGPGGSGRQQVLPIGKLDFSEVDLSALPLEVAEARGDDEAQRLNAQPFDLACGPLLRVMLLSLAPGHQRLVLVMHHIVSDGMSMQLLLDELALLYRASLHQVDTPVLPPASTLQYVDYAAWHAKWLDSGVRELQLAWWRTQLGDSHPVLALPADEPRLAVARYRVARHSFALPAPLVGGLRAAALGHGATLFMALLTGFQALLHRHTDLQDIRVGVPVANRRHPDAARLLGFFVNTQVLRCRVDGRTRLSDLLATTREAAVDAQAYQDLPFEQLVESLQPERSLAHPALFQVLFNYLQEDFAGFEACTGCRVSTGAINGQAAQFELSVEIRELSGGQIDVRLDYAAELFRPATIERLGRRFLRLLEALANDPQQRVGDVDLCDVEEIGRIAAWSCGDADYALGNPLHVLFEAQASLHPDRVALLFGETSWTYSFLNRQANRLAHNLIELGVRAETRVGVAMERSSEMVLALLAVIKAGGAYVPLDPEHPAERLQHMAADSGITLLLTQSRLRERLGDLPSQQHTLALDGLDLSGWPEHNPAVPLHGENLVYLIFTSGSTGRPKGAGNRHGALSNRIAWSQRHQPLTASDTVLQKTPFGFDISFWEFFWPLSVGARLALAGPGEHRDPARIAQLVVRHQVTTIHFVPSMLQAFVSSGQAQRCTGLRHIICSGEALPAELRARTLAALPQAGLLNLYGPTEAAIDVTWHDCHDDGSASVPIGRPMGRVKVQVVDGDLNPVPQGVPGELLLGGLALARGYWMRPGLTAERFIASPDATLGERAYRTGDLVRWREDGELEYLGRLDHQVKIRGFRIELGEIEAALLAEPGVLEAVVVAANHDGGSRLVAYYAAEGAREDDGKHAAAVRATLGRTLPDYMVPAQLVRLERLPLNSNGKVDRKALPVATFAPVAAFEAPSGTVAEAIAGTWRELLGLKQVGLHDNFFDLGGHSLMLISMHRLLEDRLAPGLSVMDMFQHPTIASLVKRIEQAGDVSPGDAEIQEQRSQRRRAALLSRRNVVEGTN